MLPFFFYLYQNEEMAPFKEFLSMLKSSLTSLHSALVEVNVSQLSDELLELDLVELDNEVKTSPTPVEHKLCFDL